MAGWITDERYRALLDAAPHVEYIGLVDYPEALRRTYGADAVFSYYDPALEINRTANSSKMFDAFMCGTAVLANEEPPSAKIVREAQCGSLLPFEDDRGLREVIGRWRDDRRLAASFGQNGRRLFEQRLNWETVRETILDIYRNLGLNSA